jgi:hypothetical protein
VFAKLCTKIYFFYRVHIGAIEIFPLLTEQRDNFECHYRTFLDIFVMVDMNYPNKVSVKFLLAITDSLYTFTF